MPDELPPKVLDGAAIFPEYMSSAAYGAEGYSYAPAPLAASKPVSASAGLKTGIGVIDGILGIFGAFSKHDADTNALTAQTAEYGRSAHMEDANAVAALTRGARAAGMARQKGTQLAQQQRMAYASEGIDTTTGTAASVAASTGAYAEADALMIRANAMSESLGHKTVAGRYRYQQGLQGQRQAALDTELASNVAGSVLGIASSVVGLL